MLTANQPIVMRPTESSNQASERQNHYHFHNNSINTTGDEKSFDINLLNPQTQQRGNNVGDTSIVMMNVDFNGNDNANSDNKNDDEDIYDDSDYFGSDGGEHDWLNGQREDSKDFNETMKIDTTIENNNSILYLNEIEINRAVEEETIAELVKASENGELLEESHQNRMRLVFGIILRLMMPLANGVAYSWKGIRDVRFLQALKDLTSSRQTLRNMIACAANSLSMSLSSVQVSYRIEPLLTLLKIHKSQDGVESNPASPTTQHPSLSFLLREPRGSCVMTSSPIIPDVEQKPAKCVSLNILAEPPPGTPIRADIVVIHGLHGSLKNTWKQGVWSNNRRPVNFERPPKPPVRPPKRQRHSRSNIFQPPHLEKRARITVDGDSSTKPHSDSFETDLTTEEMNNDFEFSYECGDPEEIKMCDDIEYSFPTFRLRMDDSSHILQLEAALKDEESNKAPSPDDPNYSNCWPGDWLPLDFPGVRVLAVNYTTDPYLWRPVWTKKEPRSNLAERAREMTEILIEHHVGCGHPIIWVGHSKGGLYIKQIIVDAWETGRPAAAPFWRSSRGAFFYSVPHRGSHLASMKFPLMRRSVELIDIEKNSKYLLDLHRRFAGLYQMGHLKIEVFSFVETALTLMSLLYLKIVGVDSADPGIGDVCGIQLDHRQICKPRSRECILYKELVKMIKKIC